MRKKFTLLLPSQFVGATIGEVQVTLALPQFVSDSRSSRMSHATIDQAIQDFFRAPSVDRYQIAQTAIVECDDYDPSARDVTMLEARISAGHYPVSAEIARFPSAFQLCPRFHFIQARLYERIGRASLRRTSVQHMQLCLRAISGTGEGTSASPYRITFLTDADDLVRAIGESVRCQQLISSPDGYRDVLTAHSGEEFWFDVETLLEHTSREAALARSRA